MITHAVSNPGTQCLLSTLVWIYRENWFSFIWNTNTTKIDTLTEISQPTFVFVLNAPRANKSGAEIPMCCILIYTVLQIRSLWFNSLVQRMISIKYAILL